ncbi:MAG: PQQ-dependent sugar dehydrogenase [Gammaproteobacteria bacterium]
MPVLPIARPARSVTPLLLAIALPSGLLTLPPSAQAAPDFRTVRLTSGLSRPLYLTAPVSEPDHVYVLEQYSGNVLRVDRHGGNVVPASPFLQVGDLSSGNEQGLLGLAFHPDYATNGYFYVNHTDSGGTTRITRYQRGADPAQADAASATPVLSYAQPQANHNGGWMGFGPDGYLYVASGDGGGGNDDDAGHKPGIGHAQDITDNLLGKLLRIDVDGDAFPGDAARNYAIPAGNPFVGLTGDDEIWAYGLRNPWRASFDRLTGDLYFGDVGQNAREEVNVQPAASAGGENYGWRLREGTIATPGVGGAAPPDAVAPVYEYAHGSGPLEGSSITGGYVYRGAVEPLQGQYFFADFVNGRIWSFEFDGSDPADFDGDNVSNFIDWTGRLMPDMGSIDNVASFGEDAVGNLYLVDLDGEVFVLQPVPLPASVLLLAPAALLAMRRCCRRARASGR